MRARQETAICAFANMPPSNYVEKLHGNLAGFHAIRVNNQWRLIFRWDGRSGEATDIYLDDHSYR
jgi:proteic killer suppression protein